MQEQEVQPKGEIMEPFTGPIIKTATKEKVSRAKTIAKRKAAKLARRINRKK